MTPFLIIMIMMRMMRWVKNWQRQKNNNGILVSATNLALTIITLIFYFWKYFAFVGNYLASFEKQFPNWLLGLYYFCQKQYLVCNWITFCFVFMGHNVWFVCLGSSRFVSNQVNVTKFGIQSLKYGDWDEKITY